MSRSDGIPHGRIVLVANDVGGLGGMERQLAQLILGLLTLGRHVTVIARTCELREHARLRFVKVRGPSRPFSIAYPVFFVIASLLARHHKGEILHATGAIIANQVDVSTVHYCHRAATTTGLVEPRSSRSSYAYHLNARVAEHLSRVGEQWCYRPERAALLCAVSAGLGSELRAAFPDMASRVRTVANGVDVSSFRPSSVSRSAIRGRLGLDDDTLVAVFVGGDWDRKGLTFAVGALSGAPEWHLVVAGDGDEDDLRQRAGDAGVSDRLHLLGSVDDTATVYAAADAFVLPTAYETFSLVTYEAAASELPLLVTRVSGVEDLLRDGSNGWFIERDTADIAARLTSLARNQDLMRSMGRRARQGAHSFSWSEMVAGYARAYEELANVDG